MEKRTDIPGRRLCGGCVRHTALALLLLCCAGLRSLAAGPVVPGEAFRRADAVASVRVTRVSEELQGEMAVLVVNLSVAGAASGLAERREITIRVAPGGEGAAQGGAAAWPLGGRFIILFAGRDARCEVVARLELSSEGRLADGADCAGLALAPGTDADAAVAAIAERLGKPRCERDRPPVPPKARSQPWNLMRSSPLRRVWPFFPR